MTIVKFYNGKVFLIEENKIIEIDDSSDFEIFVTKEINDEEIKEAMSKGYKLFECKEEEKECLSKIYNILYAKKKSCKFT